MQTTVGPASRPSERTVPAEQGGRECGRGCGGKDPSSAAAGNVGRRSLYGGNPYGGPSGLQEPAAVGAGSPPGNV